MTNLRTLTTDLLVLALPNPTPQRPEGMEGVDTLFNIMMWGGFSIAILALMVGGALLALMALGRTQARDALEKIAWPILGAIVIGAAAGLIGMFAG